MPVVLLRATVDSAEANREEALAVVVLATFGGLLTSRAQQDRSFAQTWRCRGRALPLLPNKATLMGMSTGFLLS